MHNALWFWYLSEYGHDVQWWEVYSGLLPRPSGYRGEVNRREFAMLNADLWTVLRQNCNYATASDVY